MVSFRVFLKGFLNIPFSLEESLLKWEYFNDLFGVQTQISDTFPKQGLLAQMIDHPEKKDDSDGDKEEFEHRVHSSSLTTNLVGWLLTFSYF